MPSSDGTLSEEAAARMADAFTQTLLAIAQGDPHGRDVETAKMRHIIDNPRSREASADV